MKKQDRRVRKAQKQGESLVIFQPKKNCPEQEVSILRALGHPEKQTHRDTLSSTS